MTEPPLSKHAPMFIVMVVLVVDTSVTGDGAFGMLAA